MGFCEILTLAFIVLKLIGAIDWSWFFVILPELLKITFFGICIILTILGFRD